MEPMMMSAIASLIGSGLSALGPLFGKSAKQQQVNRFTPDQQSALNNLLQQGQQNTNFDAIENRARQQFSQQGVPSLAERFTSLGAGGTRSSAFQGALARGQSDLDSQLAGMRGQFGLQQLGLGMTPQFDTIERSAQPGYGAALSGLGGGLTSLGMLGMGQGMGMFGNSPSAMGAQAAPAMGGGDTSGMLQQLMKMISGGNQQGFQGGGGMALSPQQGTSNLAQYLQSIL